MSPRKRIAFVNCYFGKFPWYFNYFVHSCKYNPTIDFYIITDNDAHQETLPPNVKLVFKTLETINSIATAKLGFQTNIKDGYKLCDFKPTYGLLFDDILSGYDFWGMNDIDIILGNISSFITDEILDTYELISVRPDYITGYFSLFKNNEKMNTLFMHSKDYKHVLSSDIHYCFDETNFKHKEFAIGIQFNRIVTEVESMTHVVRRLQVANQLKAYFNWHVVEACPGKLRWERGTLVYKNEFEAILYHLITLKETYKPGNKKNIPEVFKISATRIYHDR
jgi:hypothetical protein